jgi:hypothetical protein
MTYDIHCKAKKPESTEFRPDVEDAWFEARVQQAQKGRVLGVVFVSNPL